MTALALFGTRIESGAVATAPPASVTRTVKLHVCAMEGVPLMTPPEDRASPLHKPPAAISHVYPARPPVAERACEYKAPTVPLTRVDVMTAGAAYTVRLTGTLSGLFITPDVVLAT